MSRTAICTASCLTLTRDTSKTFSDYDGLYAWSVSRIPEFWASVWDFVGIRASQGYDRVIDDERKMPGAHWFPGARLNFAENLLRFRDDDRGPDL